jgi:ubiquinone/menaquinone biosynthesis C-methylase UbiE
MNLQTDWYRQCIDARAGDIAEVYERALVPTIFAPWATVLLARAEPHAGARVLDVACGTGAVTRIVAAAVGETGHVVGLDVNPAMLAVARAVPTAAPIEWCEGSAARPPFPAGTFDLVLCQQGLQFVPEPERAAALAEMYRVLRPGGRLALSVWRSIEYSPAFAELAAALARHMGAQAGVLAPFALGDAEEVPQLVAAAGFGEVTDEVVARTLRFPSPGAFVQCYVAGTPLAATFAATGETTRAAVVADVLRAMARYVDAAGMACPMATRIVTGRRRRDAGGWLRTARPH